MNDSCQMCGAAVRIQHRRMAPTLAEAQGTVMEIRVCTNPQCWSNRGEMSLGDVV